MQEDNRYLLAGIGAIRRLRDFFDIVTLLSVYFALFQPHFDYCCEVWDVFGLCQVKRLQKLHNRSARVLNNMSNEVSLVVALNSLGWETLEAQRKKNKAKLMFKVLNNLEPQSLTDLFTNKRDITNYNLREVSYSLQLPQPRTNNLKTSFSYDGAIIWNSLPAKIRECDSLLELKRNVDAHSFSVLV